MAAPGIPLHAVNGGDRQLGRVSGDNVIDPADEPVEPDAIEREEAE